MALEKISANKCHGGVQYVFRHVANSTRCAMRFSAFVPAQAERGKVPVLFYLSGLTCTEENFTIKAGAQQHAARHGIVVIAPDTSPRGKDVDGNDVPNDPGFDLGQGAGFYVNATQAPWSTHYRMYDYVIDELPALVAAELPVDPARQSVFGHSMGGHGALIAALRNPGKYKSVSAFAPLCSPSQVALGQKAFTAYLGSDPAAWAPYEALALVKAGHKAPKILVDQGDQDEFYQQRFMFVDELAAACRERGQPVELRVQKGYDHSYYFVQSFMEDHFAHHAKALAN